jgi:hypothetical protein
MPTTLLRRRAARPVARTASPPAAASSAAPDWSERTLALLSELSPLERAFAEWYASGLSAAEAFRRAAGLPHGPAPDASRQQGYKLRTRPRVKAAIEACLGDRNLGARLDREALLAKLFKVIEQCEGSDHPRDKATLVGALLVVARMQGYLTGRRPSPPLGAKATASEPSQRLADLIANAQAALGPSPTKAQPNGGNPDRDGRTPGPPSDGPAPPQPTDIPISAAAADQLATTASRARPESRGYLLVPGGMFMGVA